MTCYRKGGCGPYEMLQCGECPASKPEYAQPDGDKKTPGIKRTTSASDLQIVKNYLSIHRRRGRRNWEIVQTLLLEGTTHAGRTSASRKCLEMGIDPDTRDLKPCENAAQRRAKLEGI